jgi:hypothetical protein
MLGLYYRIWVDSIARARSLEANKDNWPLITMTYMSISMSLNFILIMTILEHVLSFNFYDIKFDSLPKIIGNIFSFMILFVVPCVVINYLLIFRNKRYELLLKKYPSHNGKLFVTYFLVSMILPIILVWAGILLS